MSLPSEVMIDTRSPAADLPAGPITVPVIAASGIDSGNVNVNDILATAFASKGTPSGGLKQSGVGARHGDQGLLKYTDGQSIAVLKKQVMEPQGNQTYDAYAKQTQLSLRLMRKTRLR